MKIDKKFLSIGEVAKLFDLEPATIRLWERYFPQMRPTAARVGDKRRYNQRDVEKVDTVYRLLKVKKMTIEGARRVLLHTPAKVETSAEVLRCLSAIREDLCLMRKMVGEWERKNIIAEALREVRVGEAYDKHTNNF